MIRPFLLSFSLVIIVGGFLLVWDSPPESFMRRQVGQIEQVPSADSYMNQVTSRRFSRTGSQQFMLTAPRVEFFAHGSAFSLQQPHFVSDKIKNNAAGSRLSLVADSGRLLNNQTLVLTGNVQALIDEQPGDTQLSTNALTYNLNTQVISSKDSFQLQTPQVKLSGRGLNANLADRVFTIKSKVRATHEAI